MPADPAQRPTIAVPTWVWRVAKRESADRNIPVGKVIESWAKRLGYLEPKDPDGGISR